MPYLVEEETDKLKPCPPKLIFFKLVGIPFSLQKGCDAMSRLNQTFEGIIYLVFSVERKQQIFSVCSNEIVAAADEHGEGVKGVCGNPPDVEPGGGGEQGKCDDQGDEELIGGGHEEFGDQYDDDHSRRGQGGCCDTAYEELVGRDQGGCGDLDVDESVQEGQRGVL